MATLEFNGEDEGDETYNSENTDNTEPNSSDDEADIPLAIILELQRSVKRVQQRKKRPQHQRHCIVWSSMFYHPICLAVELMVSKFEIGTKRIWPDTIRTYNS